jgi:four helix bundle protein
MSYIYSFENLDVYKLAKDFIVDLYKLTGMFPKHEIFCLTSQIRRAAISVASNLAEGSSRSTDKDKAHFTQISYGSMLEIVCQLTISKELGYVSNNEYMVLRDKAEKITNKLKSLRNFQLNNIDK